MAPTDARSSIPADGSFDEIDVDSVVIGSNSEQVPRRPVQQWGRDHRHLFERGALAVLLPLVLFALLRPERYSLLPNGLDPMFYTAYAINFDDMLPTIDGGYYFVTRWPAYLPSRFASDLFGPSLGRLLLRWVVASAMLLSLWNLGRRSNWNRPTQVVVGIVALSSPMFVRAYLSDYPEWLFSSVGVILVCECLASERCWQRSLLIGGLIAAMVISNPFSLMVAGPPTLYYAVRRPVRVASLLGRVALVLSGCGLVILVGRLWFEWRYGFNPYSATIDFLTDRSGQRDLLKSPRLSWMASFTWIYIPGLLLAAAVVPQMRRWTQRVEGARAAAGFLLVQYVWQIADQFIRDGDGLEISYYWIAIYPSLAVLFSLVIGAIDWTWRTCGLFAIAWVSVILLAASSNARLPSGWPLVAIGVAALVAAALMVRHQHPAWLVVAVTLSALALQSLAPNYDPSAYHPFNTDPQYDNALMSWQTDGTRALSDAIWLESVLDKIPDDTDLHFETGPRSGVLPAIYGAHVTGRLLGISSQATLDMAAQDRIIEFSQTGPHVVAFVGDPTWLQSVTGGLSGLPVLFEPLLDEVHDGGSGVGVLVGVLDSLPVSAGSWTASELSAETGVLNGSARRGRAGVDAPGHLAFGPYIRTTSAALRATLTYRSSAAPSESDGVFDVAIDGVAQWAQELPGTDGEVRTAVIEFVGDSNGQTEFRTRWSGSEDFEVLRVDLTAPAADD